MTESQYDLISKILKSTLHIIIEYATPFAAIPSPSLVGAGLGRTSISGE